MVGTTVQSELKRSRRGRLRPRGRASMSERERAKLRFSLLRASVMGGDLRCEGSEEADQGREGRSLWERGS